MNKIAMQSEETRFALAVVELLKYFNLIDTNVGLCLSHLMNPGKAGDSYAQLANQTSQQRFEKLRAIVSEGVGYPDPVDTKEFESWFVEATRAREIRNRYIHGNWAYLPQRTEGPIEVRSPVWMTKKLGPLSTEYMTVSELEQTVASVKSVSDQLMILRGRHSI